MTKRTPTYIDQQVGLKLKKLRLNAGLSRRELGETVDLSGQQIEKYENAINRINLSVLEKMTKIFDVPLAYFFDEYGGEFKGDLDVLDRPDVRRLIKSYCLIRGTPRGDAVLNMITALSKEVEVHEPSAD